MSEHGLLLAPFEHDNAATPHRTTSRSSKGLDTEILIMSTMSFPIDMASHERPAQVGDRFVRRIPLGVRFVKRSIDIVIAVLGLLAVAALLPLLMLAIYVDSPGPVFFQQRRAAGIKKRTSGRLEFAEFEMLKFRTMRPDAERYTGAVLAGEDDPRITRVGRFLRKTRLDELPQL